MAEVRMPDGVAASHLWVGDRAISTGAQTVLTSLIERYESSKGFVSGERTSRRVQLRITDAVLPGYQSGGMDPDHRKAMHDDLRRLAGWGMVQLQWVRFEEENLLDKLYLQWDGVDAVYALLGRTPKGDKLGLVLAELARYRSQLTRPWMQAWMEDVASQIAERKSLGALLPDEDDKRRWLLDAMAGLVAKGEEELPLRLFSKRYLLSSKVFEQHVKGRLLSILRRYAFASVSQGDTSRREFTVVESELTDEELLAEVGLEQTSEDVSFCGPLRLVLASGRGVSAGGNVEYIDCASFPHGLSLDTETVRGMQVVELRATRILSIENKANYRHYVRNERRDGELVVYLAGFHSPLKRQFLRKLYRFAEAAGAEFRHWGDIDYGGILICQSLRDTVWPTVTPWRMEAELLDTYRTFVEPFDDSYRKRLERLLENPRYAEFYPVIRRLLEVGGVLEQEALIV